MKIVVLFLVSDSGGEAFYLPVLTTLMPASLVRVAPECLLVMAFLHIVLSFVRPVARDVE